MSSIVLGYWHTCAIANGGVYCWGSNESGRLGNGNTTDSAVPVHVQDLTSSVVELTAGQDHTCALVNESVLCWGSNERGQLGNDSSDCWTPTQVQGLESGVATISCGATHTCAVLKDGTYCWGDNSYGQLGDGHSDTVSSIPVQVWGLSSGVTGIDGGGYHTCAMVNDSVHHSSVSCWGYNRYGQLGNNATEQSALPMQVQGMISANTNMSAGYMHTCSVSNERAYCWGDNYYGQLGDNSTTARSAPVQVHFQ